MYMFINELKDACSIYLITYFYAIIFISTLRISEDCMLKGLHVWIQTFL